jgi:hypothetical protein
MLMMSLNESLVILRWTSRYGRLTSCQLLKPSSAARVEARHSDKWRKTIYQRTVAST